MESNFSASGKTKINKIDAKSKEELDSYVATFDQENSQLREKITELNEEFDNLVAERDQTEGTVLCD